MADEVAAGADPMPTCCTAVFPVWTLLQEKQHAAVMRPVAEWDA